jgi:histone H3/H4
MAASGDNSLKLGSIEKIAKFASGKRIAAEAVKVAQEKANAFVDGVLHEALGYVEAAKRKTLFHDDVVRGFQAHTGVDYPKMITRLGLATAGSAVKSPSKGAKNNKGRKYEFQFIHIESSFSKENLRNYAKQHLNDLRVEPQALLTLMNLTIVQVSELFAQAGQFVDSNKRNTIKERDVNAVTGVCGARPKQVTDFTGAVPGAPPSLKKKAGSAKSSGSPKKKKRTVAPKRK